MSNQRNVETTENGNAPDVNADSTHFNLFTEVRDTIASGVTTAQSAFEVAYSGVQAGLHELGFPQVSFDGISGEKTAADGGAGVVTGGPKGRAKADGAAGGVTESASDGAKVRIMGDGAAAATKPENKGLTDEQKATVKEEFSHALDRAGLGDLPEEQKEAVLEGAAKNIDGAAAILKQIAEGKGEPSVSAKQMEQLNGHLQDIYNLGAHEEAGGAENSNMRGAELVTSAIDALAPHMGDKAKDLMISGIGARGLLMWKGDDGSQYGLNMNIAPNPDDGDRLRSFAPKAPEDAKILNPGK